MSGYLTMQGHNGVRIWVHDGLYRVQRRRDPMPDKDRKLQEVWESHREGGQVKMFGTWQEAEEYIRDNNIV